MGTNYYANHWKHGQLHIAKRSAGWKPTIKPHDCTEYESWSEFVKFIDEECGTVENEYGEILGKQEFLDMLQRWEEENNRENRGRGSWTDNGVVFKPGGWA